MRAMLIRGTNMRMMPVLVNLDMVIVVEPRPPTSDQSGDGGVSITVAMGAAHGNVQLLNSMEDIIEKWDAAKAEQRGTLTQAQLEDMVVKAFAHVQATGRIE